MTGAIVCAFDTYFDRVELLKEYYESKGQKVIVIGSDFSHRLKQYKERELVDISIHTREYHKNLSIDRLRNHYEFSKKAKEEIDKIQPDWIHCFIPANTSTKQMAIYKKEHKDVRLIFDVIDLWPETMPIQKFEWIPPLKVWKNYRDKYIDEADLVFTECELYQRVLRKEHNPKYHTLHWSRKEMPIESNPNLSESEMNFCYLGSINNIIDISLIEQLLSTCQKYKTVKFHIIGKGENKEELIQRVQAHDIEVIDYGLVYDQEQKQKIFDQCHYALNVMKSSVVVGLSMKSLDYMCAQIPMINTIKGDTKELCEAYDIGWNINMDNLEEIAQKICSESLDKQMKRRMEIKCVYVYNFTQKSFNKILDEAGVLNV